MISLGMEAVSAATQDGGGVALGELTLWGVVNDAEGLLVKGWTFPGDVEKSSRHFV